MADIYDLIDPATLTDVARRILADEDREQNIFRLGAWFPDNLVDRIDFDFSTGTTRTYTPAAPFRAFTTPPRLGSRPGRTRVSGNLPPISIEYELTEWDKLQQAALAATGGDAAEVVQGDVFADIVRGVKAIQNRMELVASDLLVDGSTVISENGLTLTVDVGRDAAREATAGIPWSTSATATPFEDEEAVLDVLEDEEGISRTELATIMNRATWREYKATTQVRSARPTFRILDTMSVSAANEVRQDNDFPEVVVYNASITGPDGVNRKVIPDGKVIYVPKTMPIGETQYGVPAIANEPELNLERDDRPGPVAYMTRQVKPLVVSTVVDALGIPVFRDPDATYVLTV